MYAGLNVLRMYVRSWFSLAAFIKFSSYFYHASEFYVDQDVSTSIISKNSLSFIRLLEIFDLLFGKLQVDCIDKVHQISDRSSPNNWGNDTYVDGKFKVQWLVR